MSSFRLSQSLSIIEVISKLDKGHELRREILPKFDPITGRPTNYYRVLRWPVVKIWKVLMSPILEYFQEKKFIIETEEILIERVHSRDHRRCNDFIDRLIVKILANTDSDDQNYHFDPRVHNEELSFIRRHVKNDYIHNMLNGTVSNVLVNDVRDRARRINHNNDVRFTGKYLFSK